MKSNLTQTSSPKVHFLARALFFLIYATIGLFNSYLTIYYRGRGLSGTQIGFLVTLASFMGTISAVVIGMLQDRYGKTRILFTILCLGAMLCGPLINQTTQYSTLLMVIGSFALFASPLMALIDGVVIRILGAYPEKYGVYRLWGTIGFILTNPIAGVLYDRYGIKRMFTVFPFALGLFWLCTVFLPDQPPKKGISMFRDMRKMVNLPQWKLFTFYSFLTWFSAMGGMFFLGVMIKDLGGSEKIVGLAFTIAALSEIPFMLFSLRILQRVKALKLLAVCSAAYTIRLLLYSLNPYPQLVPWISIFQGITYVIFNIGTVSYANQIAPDELKATSQGLLWAILNLSNLSSGLFSGWFYDHADRTGLYGTLSGIALLSLVVLLTGSWWIKRKSA